MILKISFVNLSLRKHLRYKINAHTYLHSRIGTLVYLHDLKIRKNNFNVSE